MNDTIHFDGFEALGLMIQDLTEKTATDKASENLNIDSYISGLEMGIGSDSGVESFAKTAAQLTGREIMKDFIPGIFLSKE